MTPCPACNAAIDESVRFCPHCGYSLHGLERSPGWIRRNIDLRLVARWQRTIIWAIVAQGILYWVVAANPALWIGPPGMLQLVLFIGAIALNAALIVQFMAAMKIALGWRILALILSFAPCVPLGVLLLVNDRAIRMLRAAGLRVGLMGVADAEIVRLLSTDSCRTCGYNLYGNVSGVCPECGTLVPRDSRDLPPNPSGETGR